MRIVFDPSTLTYEELLQIFWQQTDPTDETGQFADRGPQYRSIIFYVDEQQKEKAEESKQKLAESGRFSQPIVTPVLPASEFYPAEDYHQDFYKKNEFRYALYRKGSGNFFEGALAKRSFSFEGTIVGETISCHPGKWDRASF